MKLVQEMQAGDTHVLRSKSTIDECRQHRQDIMDLYDHQLPPHVRSMYIADDKSDVPVSNVQLAAKLMAEEIAKINRFCAVEEIEEGNNVNPATYGTDKEVVKGCIEGMELMEQIVEELKKIQPKMR